MSKPDLNALLPGPRVASRINKPMLYVFHAQLERASSDSLYKSYCPICERGLLLISRHRASSKLERDDRCVLCGQTYHYLDAMIGNEQFHDGEVNPEVVAEQKAILARVEEWHSAILKLENDKIPENPYTGRRLILPSSAPRQSRVCSVKEVADTIAVFRDWLQRRIDAGKKADDVKAPGIPVPELDLT